MTAFTVEQERLVDGLYSALGAVRVRYCPYVPTARQEAFLQLRAREVFFGGAAAGGKSAALLMAALQYADIPGYHALLLRRTLTELSLPGNLIELSHEWLADGKAVWSGELKQWRFAGRGRSGAGGATLTFGYLADGGDAARYAGSSFSFLGFDELTRFPETLYRRVQRVLRQPTGLHAGPPAPDGTRLGDVPIRVRSASNPGGEYHDWVKNRFVDPETREPGALFLPSRLEDNPHIDHADYERTLNALPAAERERLRYGNWEIPDDGELFKREWFPLVEARQLPETSAAVRYWDLAGSEPGPANPDPDYTVGLRLELDDDGNYWITDIVRVRQAPGAIEKLVAATAGRDGLDVQIVIEEEGGASGKAVLERYKRHVLRGFVCRGDRPGGPKDVRAHPVAAAAENGFLRLVRGPHAAAFLDELSSFPHGRHDDLVDALAGAHKHLSQRSGHRSTVTYSDEQLPGVPDDWYASYWNFPI